MKEWITDCWNVVMDYEKNPLKKPPNIPSPILTTHVRGLVPDARPI